MFLYNFYCLFLDLDDAISLLYSRLNCFFLDFDGDDMLGVNDLKQVIGRLIGDQHRLPESDIKHLIQVSFHLFTIRHSALIL